MINSKQQKIWEQEYRNPQLVTKDSKPQACTLRFLKFLRKQGFVFENSSVLDLGSGTGRNANHIAGVYGARVVGMEFSGTAVKLAKARAQESDLSVDYRQASIGEKFSFTDKSFDIILDITSSNSLNRNEREIYLAECARVLKDDGYFFVRALSLEGDVNAKNLLKKFSGTEAGTYVMPGIGLCEKVFTREEIIELYQKYFTILKMDKDTGYTKFQNQSYKRNFWIMYLRKRIG
ncbi:MAG: Methyltransferase [Candidatus Falkowbacteria bacterium GW2011_GWC2_38_22]|uniref:Methyltransferase n=1 Tax=Candidatus Falkowbacteria bacterium GW2011_GWE1_38_31 TaxID=1618638 RepID=A0A0G0M9L4_9BACT|nr:MAG: Methyltransferase [Candidatus Falkowbacteria bacterium GW2011_GWF2_38_1205]KKQ61512.1 MAG: Methyltransferase [Candidatus Falkowbacteria bacterium GW2011_GWC2_38_22]KKQ63595.1 MAG: Methyltransferase [Candidatus Falkowbacteria bacterium GW2011_GWF1_38_22]KKQ65747.1 MAG: Methyltransferase [Candidatus Falkowbacteria bacterium GW2011_GWE2_38_254]KKQ70364.1 MAG: Methyltransferase [Candidatus Falkowbacteria bacterium GW2011_GWE1_38_31]KKQ72869.1 MAG: Methyltransferase [Candidatus Falkowbacter